MGGPFDMYYGSTQYSGQQMAAGCGAMDPGSVGAEWLEMLCVHPPLARHTDNI